MGNIHLAALILRLDGMACSLTISEFDIEARAIVASYALHTHRPGGSIRPRVRRTWGRRDSHGYLYSHVDAWKAVGAIRFRDRPGRQHFRSLQYIPLALQSVWRHPKRGFGLVIQTSLVLQGVPRYCTYLRAGRFAASSYQQVLLF